MEEEREEGEERREEEEGSPPSHLPLAPPFELCDTSTTVDPSYIISLMRKLLPLDLEKQPQKDENNTNSIQVSQIGSLEQDLTKDCNGMKKTMATKALDDYTSGRNLVDDFRDKCEDPYNDKKHSSDANLNHGMNQEFGGEERTGVSDTGKTDISLKNDPWEDSGCILWDLSASETHADFMVSNLLLEVLLANLHVSKSVRVKEICLGIIGNVACHDVLSSAIVSTNGLLETVIQQLFLDDSTCLSELFRLFTVGLQGSKFISWTEVLLSEQVLLRILWIIGNTLNSVLLEKSIEFLITVINNQEVSNILLQPLIKLGLPSLVDSLLAGEISKLPDGNNQDRSSVNDLILGLVEALSATDSCPQVITSNSDVLSLVCSIVKLPDKLEVATSCVSAVVIIANLLVDEERLMLELSKDFSFLQGLLDILPFVSDDPQARNALWCTVARLLSRVIINDISISSLHEFASVFVGKSHLIEEDIEGHPMEEELVESVNPDAHKSYATTSSLRRIACILEKWLIVGKTANSEQDVAGDGNSFDSKLQRLLNNCHKYVRS